MSLSEKDRIEILMMYGYGERRRTTTEVCALFNEAHQDRPPIVRSTVTKIIKKFSQHGHVRDLPKTGQKQINEDKELEILLGVAENPNVSSRQIALNANLSHTSVLTILHKHKFHPYKVTLTQELSEDDFDRRVEFCEQLQNLCNNDVMFVKNIIFSDEASFFLNGTVNRQNCRYWASQNPRWMEEGHTQYPRKVNVWAGIVRNRILGPYFFDENLTGDMYLEFLQQELIPTLTALYPDANEPNIPEQTLWYQQDGAPPHYARPVRTYLDTVFPNRWIGRRGSIEWPARSPDLTPLDFFLWGHLKTKVYTNKPTNVDDLKERIRQEVQNITPEIIGRVQNEFIWRLGYCQTTNGEQFEHLIG